MFTDFIEHHADPNPKRDLTAASKHVRPSSSVQRFCQLVKKETEAND